MIPRDTASGDHAAKRPQNRKYDGADQFPFARLRKIHQNRHRRVFPRHHSSPRKKSYNLFFLPTGKVLHDFSVPNEQYSCADPHHKLNIMCDDQKHLALCRKASCQDANLFHAFQIQSAGRFIEHQQPPCRRYRSPQPQGAASARRKETRDAVPYTPADPPFLMRSQSRLCSELLCQARILPPRCR